MTGKFSISKNKTYKNIFYFCFIFLKMNLIKILNSSYLLYMDTSICKVTKWVLAAFYAVLEEMLHQHRIEQRKRLMSRKDWSGGYSRHRLLKSSNSWVPFSRCFLGTSTYPYLIACSAVSKSPAWNSQACHPGILYLISQDYLFTRAWSYL